MEIVVIAITQYYQKPNDVDDGCRTQVLAVAIVKFREWRFEDIRAGEGFFPKYRA